MAKSPRRSRFAIAIAMAGTVLAGAASADSREGRALDLVWTRTGDIIEIQVVGQSAAPLDLTYILNVTGDSRTSNKGRAVFADGSQKILATVRTNASANWKAELLVQGGQSYTITASE